MTLRLFYIHTNQEKKEKRKSEGERKGKGPSLRPVCDNMLFPLVSFNTQVAFAFNTLGSVSKCGSKREEECGEFWTDKTDLKYTLKTRHMLVVMV